jgi:hypothetical protein
MNNTIIVRSRVWPQSIKQESILTLDIPTFRADEPIHNEAWRKMLPQFLHNPALTQCTSKSLHRTIYGSYDPNKLRPALFAKSMVDGRQQNDMPIGEFVKMTIPRIGLFVQLNYFIRENLDIPQARMAYLLASKNLAVFQIDYAPIKMFGSIVKEARIEKIYQLLLPPDAKVIARVKSQTGNPVIEDWCDDLEKSLDNMIYEDRTIINLVGQI